MAAFAVLAAGCSSDDRAAADTATPDAAVAAATPSTVATWSVADLEWQRCQLVQWGVTVSYPEGWMPDELPLRSCASFVPPESDRDATSVEIAGADDDLAASVTELLDDGWRLSPAVGLPPGLTLIGPDGEVTRAVPVGEGTTLRVTARQGTTLDGPETKLLVLRMAASVRPVRAAATPDAGAGPQAPPPAPPERPPGSRVRPEPGHVALTFDDGPHPTWTPLILDLLDEYDAPATFFVVGSAAERHPDLVREIVDRGHSVQNHTQDHDRLTRIDDDGVREQLRAADRAITGAGAPAPRCMRPPYGAVDERVRNLTAERDQDVVLWNVDTLDWRNPGVDQIIGAAVQAKDRDIIIFHDGPGDRSQTLAALPWVLEFLASSGFGFQRLCADPPPG